MTAGPQPKKAAEMRKAKIEVATLAYDDALESLQEAALAYNDRVATEVSVITAAIALGKAHRELKAVSR